MEDRQVAVIGGGPGGLYSARLIKLARPDWGVTVYERNPAQETFGFGVGLTASTLRNLSSADPESARDIERAGHVGLGMYLRADHDDVTLDGGRNIAIGRAALLAVLSSHAESAGVRIVRGTHVGLTDLDADVIVAADGVRSGVREKFAVEFGAQIDIDRGFYLWCGTDFALPLSTFAAVRNDHGAFVVHAYPYSEDRSTFLIETDEQSLRAAGLDATDPGIAGGGSDEQSLSYLREVFAGVLGGHELLGNRTRWQHFATVHTERWHHGNVVLLGDAAHTAHYSIGSGTKLALEDAIELARALGTEDDVTAAFDTYEQRRRPGVARFQQLARRSQAWWDSFPRRTDLTATRLLASFMTRAGNISIDQFAALHPDVVAGAAAAFAETAIAPEVAADPRALAETVLGAPLRAAAVSSPGRVVTCDDDMQWVPSPGEAGPRITTLDTSVTDAWGPPGDELAADAERRLRAGYDVLWLTGARSRDALLARLDTAERLRRSPGAVVGADVPASMQPDAVGALITGRVDLVRFTELERQP